MYTDRFKMIPIFHDDTLRLSRITLTIFSHCYPCFSHPFVSLIRSLIFCSLQNLTLQMISELTGNSRRSDTGLVACVFVINERRWVRLMQLLRWTIWKRELRSIERRVASCVRLRQATFVAAQTVTKCFRLVHPIFGWLVLVSSHKRRGVARGNPLECPILRLPRKRRILFARPPVQPSSCTSSLRFWCRLDSTCR